MVGWQGAWWGVRECWAKREKGGPGWRGGAGESEAALAVPTLQVCMRTNEACCQNADCVTALAQRLRAPSPRPHPRSPTHPLVPLHHATPPRPAATVDAALQALETLAEREEGLEAVRAAGGEGVLQAYLERTRKEEYNEDAVYRAHQLLADLRRPVRAAAGGGGGPPAEGQ